MKKRKEKKFYPYLFTSITSKITALGSFLFPFSAPCVTEDNSGGSLPGSYDVPSQDWLSTPSIVEISTGEIKMLSI